MTVVQPRSPCTSLKYISSFWRLKQENIIKIGHSCVHMQYGQNNIVCKVFLFLLIQFTSNQNNKTKGHYSYMLEQNQCWH